MSSFQSFTGSSRRPRNVNLSGQKNTNPFAATSWTPSASGATSRVVAGAEAERRQRKQERDRLKAAERIQRTWRGHRERQCLKELRRKAFDDLYSSSQALSPAERFLRTYTLLFAAFGAHNQGDFVRTEALARDLIAAEFRPITSGELPFARLERLVAILFAVLESNSSSTSSSQSGPQVLVPILNLITEIRPRAISGQLQRYYKVLVQACRRAAAEGGSSDVLIRAIVQPLTPDAQSQDQAQGTTHAYEAFSLYFLSAPDVHLLEDHASGFANILDLERLSVVIISLFRSGPPTSFSKDELLWLLAHYIALQRGQGTGSSRCVEALYVLLSSLGSEIRVRLLSRKLGAASSGVQEDGQTTRGDSSLPPYVEGQLVTLVEKDEITNILGRFTSCYVESSYGDVENASVLAAYILTLLRCFPSSGDDIRMRLFLGDVPSQAGPEPAVRFFWKALVRTTVFSRILSDSRAAIDLLRGGSEPRSADKALPDTALDREWRTALLFLELYIFILRLTDDDDFFSGINPTSSLTLSTSRIRSSSLSLDDLRRLALFLKNLAFALFYNAASILEKAAAQTATMSRIETYLGSGPSATDLQDDKGPTEQSAFNAIRGIEFEAFRNLVTSAMRMLYERDSRRPFLPKGHWLMTSKFDMEGFIAAVVLEEQQREERESTGDSGSDDSNEDEVLQPAFALTFLGQRRSQHARIERLREQQKRTQRERMQASMRPKLEILRNMPFVIPFETRVQIFRQFVHLDKERRRGGNIDPDRWRFSMIHQGEGGGSNHGRDVISRHHARIRRGQVFEDALEQFYDLGEGLKEPIQITFVDEWDMVEAGIDGGGVMKEFLISVTNEAFDPSRTPPLFISNSQNSLYPNPSAFDQVREQLRSADIEANSDLWNEELHELIERYEFLGRIVGKCLYEGILIDIAFAGFFLLKWSSSGADGGYRASINDLRELDEGLYQGLISLKTHQGDISDLGLDFTIDDEVEAGRTISRELMPNGSNVPVTNENRPLYVSYVARHRLVVQPHLQTRAFLRGLGTIIEPNWISMFNQSELQRLVGGDSSEISVDDLRQHTEYSGVYAIGDDGLEHPTVQFFWQVMRTLRDSERRDVLKYVTSTPRAPLLGFSQLRPAFTIRDGGSDQERLPSASTCVNLLKLPQYQSASTLRDKLLYAVTSGAGFDLS